MMLMPPCQDMLAQSYNWSHVFEYAARPNYVLPINPGISTSGFNIKDVATILHKTEGCNDADSWVIVVVLGDFRFAVVRAWCDYTGWD